MLLLLCYTGRTTPSSAWKSASVHQNQARIQFALLHPGRLPHKAGFFIRGDAFGYREPERSSLITRGASPLIGLKNFAKVGEYLRPWPLTIPMNAVSWI